MNPVLYYFPLQELTKLYSAQRALSLGIKYHYETYSCEIAEILFKLFSCFVYCAVFLDELA